MFLLKSRASQNHSPRWSQIGACRRRRRRFAPGLLPLEPRALLSTLTVTSDADSGTGSLRAELALAHNGDTIVFSPKAYGTITLTSGPLEVATGVNIKGPGASKLSVSGDDSSTVFDIDSGVTASISGLTITDGTDGSGFARSAGGIFNQGTLTLTDAVVSGNASPTGGFDGAGGIENSGTMTIAGSTISGNTGTGAGGIASYGPLSITNSTISGNSGSGLFSGAGAILSGDSNAASSLTITDSTISGNSGSEAGGLSSYGALDLAGSVVSGNLGGAFGGTFGGGTGGGIFCEGTSTITDSRIVNNTNDQTLTFSSAGGGIDDAGNLTITRSTISGNTAEGGAAFGGGISLGDSSTLYLAVKDCTFRDDQAVSNSNYGGAVGGAISGNNADATVTISGSSFAGNSAAQGGALSLTAESTSLVDCTFTGNVAGSGGAMSSRGPLTISGSSFVGNTAAGGLGGALYLDGASTGIDDCTFTRNQSLGGYEGGGTGGAIVNTGGYGGSPSPLTVSGSTFIDNSARGVDGAQSSGGAIANRNPGATLDLSSSLLVGNSAVGGKGNASGHGSVGGAAMGGALWNYNWAVATVTGSTFLGNSAAGGSAGPVTGYYYYRGGKAYGGAIDDASNASLTVTGCVIAGNSATGGAAIGAPAYNLSAGAGRGGGIFDNNATLKVTDSTISGNAAISGANGYSYDNGGGGVFISGSSANASFTDDLITLNAATAASPSAQSYGGGIFIGRGAITTLTNTVVVGNKASTAGNNIYGTYTDG